MPTLKFYATKSYSKVGHCALLHVPCFMKSTPKLNKSNFEQVIVHSCMLKIEKRLTKTQRFVTASPSRYTYMTPFSFGLDRTMMLRMLPTMPMATKRFAKTQYEYQCIRSIKAFCSAVGMFSSTTSGNPAFSKGFTLQFQIYQNRGMTKWQVLWYSNSVWRATQELVRIHNEAAHEELVEIYNRPASRKS